MKGRVRATVRSRRARWIPSGPFEEGIQVLLDDLLEKGHPAGRYAFARRSASREGPTADVLGLLADLEEEHPWETLGISEHGTPGVELRDGVWDSLKWGGEPAHLARLLDHPLARFVESLELGAAGPEPREEDDSPYLDALLDGPPRPAVRWLAFDQKQPRFLRMGRPLAQVLPRLEHLDCRVHHLELEPEALAGLGRLKSLYLGNALTRSTCEALGDALLPALEVLRLHLDRSGVAARPLLRLLSGERAPNVRYLLLNGLPAELADEALQVLAVSSLLPRLELLSMHQGVGLRAASVLRERAAEVNPGLTIIGAESSPDPHGIIVINGMEPVRMRPEMYLGGTDEPILRSAIVGVVQGLASELGARNAVVERDATGVAIEFAPKDPFDASAFLAQKAEAIRRMFGHSADGDWPLQPLFAFSQTFTLEVSDGRRRISRAARFGLPFAETVRHTPPGPRRIRISFSFDPSVAPRRALDSSALADELRQAAYLAPGKELTLVDRETGRSAEFRSRSGLSQLVRDLQRGRRALTPVVTAAAEQETCRIDVTLQRVHGRQRALLLSFVNGRPTRKGGTHLDGAVEGLCAALREAGCDLPDLPNDELVASLPRWAPGLVMVVHAVLRRPMHQAGDLATLVSPEARELAARAARSSVAQLLADGPSSAAGLLTARRPRR